MTAARRGARAPARVLLVEDSDASRAAIARILERGGGAVVVGSARDGEEALREALRLGPDLVVLDLEMPRMDGFTFLRLLMARRPTPVVVVSSRSHRADVFKALELGAVDFVAKPVGGAGFEAIAAELLEKCELLRTLRPQNLLPGQPRAGRFAPVAPLGGPRRVVAIAASTGGPPAVLTLLGALPGDLPVGFVVAQHMPERFTADFAERIRRSCPFTAQEAADGDLLADGRVLVAPGGNHLEIRKGRDGALSAVIFRAPPRGARRGPCPSADRLFRSVADAAGARACAVVLTGMGRDGGEGVRAVKAAGGLTLAESQETAVVYGMPQAAAETGALDELLPLDGIAERLLRFGRAA